MNTQEVKLCPSLLRTSMLLAVCGSVQTGVLAALPADAILAFDPGQTVCLIGGTPPNCDFFQQDVTGSYFAMDFNADDAFEANEKTAIEQHDGVRLGEIQPASGSHSGSPDGSESPSVDTPWAFFGNTGMHQTILPVLIANGDDGTGDGIAGIDFSGWGVTWNGIPNIPLGGDSTNFPFETGVAVVTCASNCDLGETYSLDYTAHVPIGDPSGFGGVWYAVHLEGTVTPGSALPPTKSVSIQVTGGSAQECSATGGSEIEATANILTTDINDISTILWTLDGEDAGSGTTVNVFTPLGAHTLSVNVDTLASGSFQDSETVTVDDNTAPDLTIRFIDQRSGNEITEVSGNKTRFVTVSYDVTDVCDSEPTASGVAVPVHAVDDGDTIRIQNKKISTVGLDTSAVSVSAHASDASGNQRHSEATLLIAD